MSTNHFNSFEYYLSLTNIQECESNGHDKAAAWDTHYILVYDLAEAIMQRNIRDFMKA